MTLIQIIQGFEAQLHNHLVNGAPLSECNGLIEKDGRVQIDYDKAEKLFKTLRKIGSSGDGFSFIKWLHGAMSRFNVVNAEVRYGTRDEFDHERGWISTVHTGQDHTIIELRVSKRDPELLEEIQEAIRKEMNVKNGNELTITLHIVP